MHTNDQIDDREIDVDELARTAPADNVTGSNGSKKF